jgi:hypothetical protein
MKIIGVDNFNRESVADFLVCENVANERVGQTMVDALNRESGDYGSYFYKLVPADHKLWRGMEELI